MRNEEEERYGAVVLSPLADQPMGPSTVDVNQAIVQGRRRKVTRRVGATAGVLAATLVVAAGIPLLVNNVKAEPDLQVAATASPQATTTEAPESAAATFDAPPRFTREPVQDVALPSSCTGTALALVDGVKETFTIGLDPTGRYAVGRHYPRDGYHAPILWDGDKATAMDLQGNDDIFSGVNSHGVAVGEGFGVGGWVYTGGKLQRAKGGIPRAINDRGQMAGGLHRWDTPLGQAKKLPLPKGYTEGSARGIGEDGTIVGLIGVAGDPDVKPYLWTAQGRGHALPAPKHNGQELTNVRAEAVSNGWAVGIGWLDGPSMAVRWDLVNGTVEVFPEMMSAEDVNPLGWFSGQSASHHAVFSNGTQTVTLPDVFAFDKEFAYNVAYGISYDGKVLAGTVTDKSLNGMNRGVRWQCR